MATIRVYSGTVGGTGDGTSWANAYTTLFAALAAEPDGTDYIVHYQHVENYTGAANREWNFSTTIASPDTCISVDKDNSDAYRKGAVVDLNNNAYRMGIGGFVTGYGMQWENGNGGSSFATDMAVCDNHGDEQVHIDSIFRVHNTSNSGIIAVGTSDAKVTFYDVEVKFAGDAYIQLYANKFQWFGGTVTYENASDLPTQLFLPVVYPMEGHVEGVDLSSAGTSVNIIANSSGAFHHLYLKRCKLAANWAGELCSGRMEMANEVVLENCGNGDLNYSYLRGIPAGEVEHQVDLYASGTVGAKHNGSDVPISHKITSETYTDVLFVPMYTAILSLFNEVTTSQTFTWEFIHNESALLQDDDVWMMISYLGTSGQPISTLKDSAYDDKFGTPNPYATPANITASTKAWDEGITARANSTAYSVGDLIKVASNTGRVFRCTASTGNSAASEPGGYATAVDGDSITDGNCTFEAMYRQKCEITVTAAEQGVVKAQLFLGKASTTIWASAELEAA